MEDTESHERGDFDTKKKHYRMIWYSCVMRCKKLRVANEESGIKLSLTSEIYINLVELKH